MFVIESEHSYRLNEIVSTLHEYKSKKNYPLKFSERKFGRVNNFQGSGSIGVESVVSLAYELSDSDFELDQIHVGGLLQPLREFLIENLNWCNQNLLETDNYSLKTIKGLILIVLGESENGICQLFSAYKQNKYSPVATYYLGREFEKNRNYDTSKKYYFESSKIGYKDSLERYRKVSQILGGF